MLIFFLYIGSFYSQIWGLGHISKPQWLASQADLGDVVSYLLWADGAHKDEQLPQLS